VKGRKDATARIKSQEVKRCSRYIKR